MFKDNLMQMRRIKRFTQEDLALRVGVTRQSIAKWESGESEPSIEKCKILAEALDISIDDLANKDIMQDTTGASKSKNLFGVVTVGDKGQIVIPVKARKAFDINPGDQLLVMGDEKTGITITKTNSLFKISH